MNCTHESSWIQFKTCPSCNQEAPTQTITEIKKQARREAIEACIEACWNTYSDDGHACGDWPTPEQCIKEIRALLDKP
jgi:hypothetical protein